MSLNAIASPAAREPRGGVRAGQDVEALQQLRPFEPPATSRFVGSGEIAEYRYRLVGDREITERWNSR